MYGYPECEDLERSMVPRLAEHDVQSIGEVDQWEEAIWIVYRVLYHVYIYTVDTRKCHVR